MADPILVLQLQRLGDLVLTFPLLDHLRRNYPAHPVIVVGEEQFYRGLERVSPPATYFPAQKIGKLKGGRFEMVLNICHRPEAAECANAVLSPFKKGKIAGSEAHIDGFWQLYRANLTQNNRHNTFHWADLNIMDMPGALPLQGRENMPAACGNSRRVGLVIGASENSKRPDAAFWARLAVLLAKKGFMPFFLGGEAEKEAGAEAARLSGLTRANLCGRLALPELAELMKGLALCITPDTGPMHLAAWLETPVLNLSMGPVHAHETGPALPGQWILRSTASCVGCWQCFREEFFCKKAFLPHKVAQVAGSLLRGVEPDNPAGLELLRAARDENGLLRMAPFRQDASVRWLLENFWRYAFLSFAGGEHLPGARKAAGAIVEHHPALAAKMRRNLADMLSSTTKMLRGAPIGDDLWQNRPLHSRLFAGHCQLWLENGNFSHAAIREVLGRQEILLDILA